MIFDKFIEIKVEYYKALSEKYEDYIVMKKKLSEYTDRLKYLSKKYNRLQEKLNSLIYKNDVNQFLTKDVLTKKSQFTQTFQQELNIFQNFMSYQKSEPVNYKLVNIMRKIFKNKMYKINEEKSRVLNYFFEKYPEVVDKHRKIQEKPKQKKNILQINSVDFSITSPISKEKKNIKLEPEVKTSKPEKKEEELKLKKRNSVKESLAKSSKSSSVKAITTRSSNNKQIFKK
jgi:hypothetical protein